MCVHRASKYIYIFIKIYKRSIHNRKTFRSIDLNRKHLLVILHRMVCFYRAEAYHVAVFSAVNTARKASEALDKVCGEVRMEIDHHQIQPRVVASGTSVFSEHH